MNGSPVDVRLARESDRTGLAEMFARCTKRTRYQRFHGHVNTFPERYLAEAISGSPVHFALVACAGFPGGAGHPGSVVALASCRTVAPDIAELGVLVEDSSQRLGIGGFLLRQIIDHAERNGLTTLKASVLAEQAWLLRVLRRYGKCEAAAACEELDVTLRLSRCACLGRSRLRRDRGGDAGDRHGPAPRMTAALAAIYRVRMSSSMSPEEIRAAAEVHNELGPGYRDAVIESFLDKVGREIDARVDARLAQQAAQPPARSGRGHSGSPMALAIASMVLGIPISAIAVAAGAHPAGFMGLVVVWIAIAVINIAYNVNYNARFRQPPNRR